LHPYLVQPGDSFTFWCYYNLENNYDVTVVEVSENTKEWFNLDTTRFTGTQTSWVRKAYSLANWVGKSVYFRFRTMYDGSAQNGGFYVDDIRPVCLFGSVNTISNSIPDTLYQFTNHPLGEYYYYVRGYNTAWGWGDYSCLEKVYVSQVAVGEQDRNGDLKECALSVHPNPFRKKTVIRYMIQDTRYKIHDTGYMIQDTRYRIPDINLKIYDATGRMVRDFSRLTVNGERSTIVWDGTNDLGRRLASGVYFVRLEADGYEKVETAILLR